MSEMVTYSGGVVVDENGEIIRSTADMTPINLFGSSNPDVVIAEASAHAKALAKVIEQQKLYKRIGDKAHVFVEGWSMLGSMLGVYAVPGDVEPVEVEGVQGFRATCEARTRAGEVVGAATAYCMRDEPNWKGKPTYAIAAMAQTRASSMALRKPLGFVMKLAGYNPTPAEEIPSSGAADSGAAPKRAPDTSKAKSPTEAQHRKHRALLAELDKLYPNSAPWEAASQDYIFQEYGVSSHAELTRDEMSKVIDYFENQKVPI